MRRTLVFFLAAAALMAAGALWAATDRIVAVVNGEIITLSQLEGRVAAMQKSGKLKGVDAGELRRKVLDALVEQELVSQAAKAKGIIITRADVSQAVEAVKRENNLTDAQLQAALAQSGSSLEAFREDLQVELMRQRVLGAQIAGKIVVTDKETLAALNEASSNPEGLLADYTDEAVAAARRGLERQKLQERYAEWLADLKSKAIVRINL